MHRYLARLARRAIGYSIILGHKIVITLIDAILLNLRLQFPITFHFGDSVLGFLNESFRSD